MSSSIYIKYDKDDNANKGYDGVDINKGSNTIGINCISTNSTGNDGGYRSRY